MSEIRIQQLHLEDCETAKLKSYFEWGRLKDEGVREPEWDLAPEELRQRVGLRGYSLYDGCPVPRDNRITATDAWITAGFSSRIREQDVVRILGLADEAEPLLARIPPHLDLCDASEQHLYAAADLIELLSSAPHVGWGKATKLLHKKRPQFIPVLDSVVRDFLLCNFPHLLHQASAPYDFLIVWRQVYRRHQRDLEPSRLALARHGFELTPVRTLDFVLWCGWSGRVGTRIARVWGTDTLGEARTRTKIAWEGWALRSA